MTSTMTSSMTSPVTSTIVRPLPPARRRHPRRTGAVVGLVAATLALIGPPALAADGDLPGGRRIVGHTVRSGETATGLAVRYHAWTAELISHNHLGSGAGLRVGQQLEIPVVVAALPHHRPATGAAATPSPRSGPHSASFRAHGAGHPGTATVRRAVAGAAASRGVDPQLALAVSWQESGWQMDRTSDAGAVGAMQVLPASARWMELYAGRDLHLHHLSDNATAGVTLLQVLGSETGSTRHAVAAYYQGLGAVREHGLYAETRAYVADVSAIRRRLEAGRSPS
jgi:LysM repeat protein